jgi:hypothetical protein
MAVLKILVKGLFLALYGWGVFVVLGLTLPVVLAGAIAVTGGPGLAALAAVVAA